MKRLLTTLSLFLPLLVALLVPLPAAAQDLVAREGDDSIRLREKPCEVEAVLSRVPQQFHSQFMAATAVVEGKTFAACWRKAGAAAHLVYEDGDQGIVPLSELKVEHGA